jgi:hypothetical protein
LRNFRRRRKRRKKEEEKEEEEEEEEKFRISFNISKSASLFSKIKFLSDCEEEKTKGR